MDKRQKRLAAIALCIAGIIGTLMASKDSSARRAQETTPAGIEVGMEGGAAAHFNIEVI